MHITFHLEWLKAGKPPKSGFKSAHAFGLFADYAGRINRFEPCEVGGSYGAGKKPAGAKVWVCDRGPTSRMLSSEDLAREIEKLRDGGTRGLHILIGGPDGFSGDALERIHSDFCWSFGPLTLPHELAAVVAGEQLYRALTILKRLPYHGGH